MLDVPRGTFLETAVAETPGIRLYLIRLACGDGVRHAERAEEFLERVRKKTGQEIHPSVLSRLEGGRRRLQLDEAEAFAAVDPLKRGPAWLAFGNARFPETDVTPPSSNAGRGRKGGAKGR